MNIFFHILTHNVVPIFILIGTGYIIGRKFKLDVQTLSKLNFYAFLPFFSFVVIYTSDLSMKMVTTMLFVVGFLVINSLISFLISGIRHMNNRKKYIFANSLLFFNAGNIGIPLITLIYEGTPYIEEALVIQITIMLTQSLMTNTIGFYNAGRGDMHWKDSIISILKMPVIYAIISALLLKQISIDLEACFFWPAFLYLKQGLIGFVLVTLGVQLSQTKFSGRDPDVLISVIMRLIGGPLIALILLKAAGITGLLGQVLFISASMPTAVNSALIAIERKAEPEFAAKTVMFSTISCAVTIVFVVYFSKFIFKV